MQQLCVIRGKLPFLSCMVSRVRLVKRSLQKSGYKTRVQPYSRAKKERTKTRVQPYRHLTRQTKKSPQFHNSITLQKKERKAPFVFM